MKKNIYIILSALIVTGAALQSCQNREVSDKPQIIATIAPVKYLVDQIVGDDFEVSVLVPAGVSPETFDPTPKQFSSLSEAEAVVAVGLIDFEGNILKRLEDKSRLVDLSAGVDLIAGSCSHNHAHDHAHGIDPHIWTSPMQLQIMAQNLYTALAELYPDSLHYRSAYLDLQSRLEELDNKVTGMLLATDVDCFVIYHPAYSYFARDYGIEQVAIEDEGKEPSARRIGQIIDRAREQGIARILYQSEFPASTVTTIASDAAAKATEVNPLREDVVAQVEEFVTLISSKQ